MEPVTEAELKPKLRTFVSKQIHKADIEFVKLTNGFFIIIKFTENKRGYEIAGTIRTWLKKHFTGVSLQTAELSDNQRSCGYHCSNHHYVAK